MIWIWSNPQPQPRFTDNRQRNNIRSKYLYHSWTECYNFFSRGFELSQDSSVPPSPTTSLLLPAVGGKGKLSDCVFDPVLLELLLRLAHPGHLGVSVDHLQTTVGHNNSTLNLDFFLPQRMIRNSREWGLFVTTLTRVAECRCTPYCTAF